MGASAARPLLSCSRLCDACLRPSATAKRQEAGSRSMTVELANPLNEEERWHIQVSWALIKRQVTHAKVGALIYRMIFVLMPDLQTIFGFTYQQRMPPMPGKEQKFTNHSDAIDELMQQIVDNCDEENFDDELVPMLVDLGRSHWGYLHTGFEARHVWAFAQAVQLFVEQRIADMADYDAQFAAEYDKMKQPAKGGAAVGALMQMALLSGATSLVASPVHSDPPAEIRGPMSPSGTAEEICAGGAEEVAQQVAGSDDAKAEGDGVKANGADHEHAADSAEPDGGEVEESRKEHAGDNGAKEVEEEGNGEEKTEGKDDEEAQRTFSVVKADVEQLAERIEQANSAKAAPPTTPAPPGGGKDDDAASSSSSSSYSEASTASGGGGPAAYDIPVVVEADKRLAVAAWRKLTHFMLQQISAGYRESQLKGHKMKDKDERDEI